MEAFAHVKFVRMSPRKVKLVCDMIRGLDTKAATAYLSQTSKAACEPMAKLLKSAVANAEHIAYAQRGEFEKCAEESFDCVGCGCCSVRCPAGITHPMVGLLARRLTGKYIAPKSEHLEKRVEEINSGAYDELIEAIMQKPISEMQELYNHRDIEK